MNARLAAGLILAALLSACARDGFVVYQDPAKLFSAEVPGGWRVLGEDGERRVTFIGEPSGTGSGPTVSVMFYSSSTTQGRDPQTFAVAHRLGTQALGPIEPATVAGAPALRYAVLLDSRVGKVRETVAAIKTDKGLFVVLYDDREDAAPGGALAYERLLSTLRF